MSKVVKHVGKVFRGIRKVVKKIGSKLNEIRKKWHKSKAFKIIATAAAIYFTGGAALGALQGAGAGWAGAAAQGAGFFGKLGAAASGAWSGAAAGLGSAWAGIAKAGGQVMSGQFSQAFGSLAQGFTGAGAAGANSVGMSFTQAFSSGMQSFGGQAMNSVGPMASGYQVPQAPQAAFNTPIANTGLNTTPVATTGQQAGGYAGASMTPPPTTPKPGLLSKTGDFLFGSKNAAGETTGGLLNNPWTMYSLTQIGGSIASGKAQEEREDQIYERDQDEIKRRNDNMSKRLWSTA